LNVSRGKGGKKERGRTGSQILIEPIVKVRKKRKKKKKKRGRRRRKRRRGGEELR
jgi:hypothetical protein